MNLSYLFERWARQGRNSPALTDHDGNTWSRGELYDRIVRLGNAFGGLGLARGERVAVLDGHTRRHIEVEYGAMTGGFVRVAIDPALTVAGMQSQLADSGARALVFDSSHAEIALQLRDDDPDLILVGDGAGGRDYESLLRKSTIQRLRAFPDDQLASLNYTGGTTGRPKAVMLTHANLCAIVQNVLLSNPVRSGERFLNVRPLWPVSAVTPLSQLLGGGHIILDRFVPDEFCDRAAHHRAESTSLVPTQVVRLFDAGLDRAKLDTLRRIDVGAAAIPPDVFLATLEAIGPKIGVLYGLTEASWSCYLPPAAFKDVSQRERLVRSVGRELFGYRVTVVDEGGAAMEGGEVGQVAISGDHVMAGYWNRPELSREVLVGSPQKFLTGDLGRLDADGYLYLVGREKEQIRSGGKTILAGEVEQTLLSHPAVVEAAVIGVSDREWGEAVHAFVVLHDSEHVLPEDLIKHCRAQLAGFKVPKGLEIVHGLPKSHYGKVRKGELTKIQNVRKSK